MADVNLAKRVSLTETLKRKAGIAAGPNFPPNVTRAPQVQNAAGILRSIGR